MPKSKGINNSEMEAKITEPNTNQTGLPFPFFPTKISFAHF